MKRYSILCIMFIVGCASGPDSLDLQSSTPVSDKEAKDQERIERPTEQGLLKVDISNVLGEALGARIQLMDEQGLPPLTIEAPAGKLEKPVPIGPYRAYVHVYDGGVPVLVGVHDITITQTTPVKLVETILEGAGGTLRLRDFDYDGDLAIDRIELESGTDPEDAGDLPGRAQLYYPSQQLASTEGWYRGDLHVHSRYGRGKESVAELMARAEKAGLDFIAITDKNSLEAVKEGNYPSDSVVLIPGMEWGNDEQGYALIYAPRTEPEAPGTFAEAQAECIRVQAQGGLFAIAHPCFPTSPWLWGLSYVNAVEVWCREWRGVPPLQLSQLSEDLKVREEGKLVHSLAAAAARSEVAGVSANEQAAYFWDCELNRGLMASAIGGSNSATPRVPLGKPVTYVYAREKSLAGILEGMRLGRTYVSSGVKGPEIFFSAEVKGDDKRNVGIGGVVPLGMEIQFIVGVKRAKGKKLQVLLNGRPIRTVPIEGDSVAIRFKREPDSYGVFRVRVIGAAQGKEGLGDLEVYALSSPIYAQDVTQHLVLSAPNLDVDKAWLRIQSDVSPEASMPISNQSVELVPR